MKLKRKFNKYNDMGAYHWNAISKSPLKRNPFDLARYKNVLSLLERYSHGIVDKRILDVGCGDGVLCYLLYRMGAKAYGVDTSKLGIALAREKAGGGNIHFHCGAGDSLPYADNSFDALICSDVIEHVDNVKELLLEIRRVVRQNGTVVISTPIRFTKRPISDEHVVEWFQEDFKIMIEAVFPNSYFCKSHPIFWMEVFELSLFGKEIGKLILNLLSYLRNPFDGFLSQFRYMALQYSVSRVE